MKGENERLLLEILNEAYPGQWVKEHMGIDGRRFKFDVANPGKKVAIEINGGIYPFWTYINGKRVKVTGRHVTGEGYEKDMEKRNLAVLNGWRLLEYTPKTIKKDIGKVQRDLSLLIGPPVKYAYTENLKIKEQVQVNICSDGIKTCKVNEDKKERNTETEQSRLAV